MKGKVIRLRKGRLGRLRPNHPWIYKRQILRITPSTKPGDVISVINSEGKFIGIGYYNPKSDISIRILSFNDEKINNDFFNKKIRVSVEKRRVLLGKTNAYRAVFSEADGLPGLVADVYSGTVVFQILTLGMEKFKEMIVRNLKDILKPKYIYEKSESFFRKLEGLKDIKGWQGEAGNANIEIYEGKAKFIVDIEKGHKTGFYLDQRKSRMALEGISKGVKVLDLFCYTGAFALSAAVFGAGKVSGVDTKKGWLDLASRNAALNGVADKAEFIKADAFSYLRNIYNLGERFDIIIIDPPSFAKDRKSVISALKGYKELNLTAMKALNEGGILATFSCSHHISNELFSDTLKQAARDAKKRFDILKRCRQAQDHPIARSIPETEYLKGYFLKVFPS